MSAESRSEIEALLIDEYWLLDHSHFEQWLELMAPDIRYWAPVRENLGRDEERFDQLDLLTHFDDDRTTLGLRVARLRSGFAHAEEPPSRTRHFVSNVKILSEGPSTDIKVASNFMIFRSRPGLEEHWFVGAREDRWRRSDGKFQLAERLIVFDHDIIENITVFV